MKSINQICILIFFLLSANLASALAFDPFSLELSDPQRERGTFWPQLASFILPGFDQWAEKQVDAGLLYSGIAVGGMTVTRTSGVTDYSSSQSAGSQISEGDDKIRAYLLGGKIYEMAGSLSVYHSFRSAVRTRQAHGEYAFLSKENEETTDQLMLAPFHFAYLLRPTTYIPIGFVALSVAFASSTGHQMLLSDGFYSATTGYGAGVSEETLFRGYISPRLMQSFDSRFWSNTTTSLLFGAAHIASDNRVPVEQFLFGWYIGWLSQHNQWTISEGIFIHTWYDVILFLYTLSDHTNVSKSISLPILNFTF